MADKNLHDIKIDDLESSKKTPLKNLLTLLALLFIILVISVVITKLILNTDNNDTTDINGSTTEIEENGSNALATTGAAIAGATGAVIAGTHNAATNTADAIKDSASNVKNSIKDGASNIKGSVKDGAKDLASTTAPLKERNVSGSKTKVPLRDHRPLSSVKELVNPKSTTKKDSASTHAATTKKSTSANTSKAKNSTSAHASTAKKSTTKHKTLSDKVIAKRTNSSKKSTSHKNSSTNKKHSTGKSVVGHTLTSGYYIKIGTFKDPKSAVNQIKKTGLNYKLIKVKNDKTLTRVFIGTFSSKANAQSNLSKAKKISKGAYIIKK